MFPEPIVAGAAHPGRWATDMKYIVVSIFIILSTTASASFFEHASGVVGLYWLPCAQDDVKHIDIFSVPDGKTPIGKVYYAKQHRYPPNDPYGMRSCEKPTVQIFGKDPNSGDHLGELPMVSLKDGAGAVILNYKDDWLEIKLDKGTAWVHDPKQRRSSQSVETLLSGDMTFLRIQPPVPVQANPDSANIPKPVKVDDVTPYTNVRILDWKSVDGKPWVKIELVRPPCGFQSEFDKKRYNRIKPFNGWLPFHDVNGQPILWFYSGGC